MNDAFQTLIKRFLDDVQKAEEILKAEFHIESPSAFRAAGIPRTGRVAGCDYSFHGIGCRFEFEDRMVDYDYGGDGRIDGFDLWRLSRYGEQFTEFEEYVESKKLENDFEIAVQAGDICRSGAEYDSLYYVAQEI